MLAFDIKDSQEASCVHPQQPVDSLGERSAAKLTRCTLVSYCSLRVVASMLDFLIRPSRTTLYRDALGMPIATLAMLISACKSLDFMWGFAVGYLSDRTSTRLGRRKPWVLICGSIWIVCTIALANPPSGLGVSQPKHNVACEAGDNNNTACPELASCINTEIQMGRLPSFTSKVTVFGDEQRRNAGAGLAVWFATFYLGFYLAGWTGTMIPYDSLAMELTVQASERSWLFGAKTFSQFIGYLTQTLAGLAMASFFANDIPMQISSQSFPFAAIGALAICAILCNVKEVCVSPGNVKERGESPTGEKSDVPLVPTVLSVCQNKAYLIYLAMKIPLTLAALLPSSFMLDFIKHAMGVEDFQSVYFLVLALILFSSFAWIPLITNLSIRAGKRKTMVGICFVDGVIMLGSFFLPPESISTAMFYAICPFLALGNVGAFVVPDAILNDIIDYGELRTGERTESIYCIVETNLQQLVEIIGGVIPMLIMGLAGFVNNGGCDCGCGVSCPATFLRWSCPADIGYACGGGPGSRLLYGAVDRPAPCTDQPPAVQLIVRFFTFGLPGIMYICGGAAASRLPITEQMHAQIMAAIEQRRAGQAPIDPVMQESLPCKLAEYHCFNALHFTALERKLASNGAGLRSIRKKIGVQLGVWLVLFSCIVVTLARVRTVDDGDMRANVVALSCLLCSGLFVLIPWDGLRLFKAWHFSDPLEAPEQQN
eukprot:CAMPEP_0117480188 /NCGR_PEP_ID=MMETSP0784-20121206/12265_1 /TAXON_ID=39447 /ORGANISM="" /LENGTH=712 /DNA_ID=CAMNT_0005274625 /DNA_START=100 /DNA_END=2238 /DNA_ORIENTATION=-